MMPATDTAPEIHALRRARVALRNVIDARLPRRARLASLAEVRGVDASDTYATGAEITEPPRESQRVG